MYLKRKIELLNRHSFYGIPNTEQIEIMEIKARQSGKFIAQYLNRKCHIFAHALHLELGYNIKLLFDLEAEFDNEDKETFYDKALVHAYCIKPDGTCIDISGKINCDTVELEYGDCNSPQYELCLDEEDLINSLNSINITKPSDIELNKVREFIRKNINKYI